MLDPETVAAIFSCFVFAMFLFIGILWLVKREQNKKIFKSFIGVEPSKRKDKKMINFMQERVDNIMVHLAKDIQKAIEFEETFLKSNEKSIFDKPLSGDYQEARNMVTRYKNTVAAIARAKKTFWKLHKIVKSYGFETKNGFKEYLECSNKK